MASNETQIFSAMLELFGQRDLAADDPSAFERSTRRFQTEVVRAATAAGLTPKDCSIVLDKCFVCSREIHRLAEFAVGLRQGLLESADDRDHAILVRGCISPGHVELTSGHHVGSPKWKDRVQTVNQTGWMIFGQVEFFKGVGIYIPSTVKDHFGAGKGNRELYDSYFVSDGHGSNVRSIHFQDIAFSPNDLGSQATNNMLTAVKEAHFRQRKLSRFFVPILLNWASHVEIDDTNECTALIDVVVRSGLFRLCHFIPGGDLVVGRVWDRAFSGTFPHLRFGLNVKQVFELPDLAGMSENAKRLCRELLKHGGWLIDRLRDDPRCDRVPVDVLSKAKKRALLMIYGSLDSQGTKAKSQGT